MTYGMQDKSHEQTCGQEMRVLCRVRERVLLYYPFVTIHPHPNPMEMQRFRSIRVPCFAKRGARGVSADEAHGGGGGLIGTDEAHRGGGALMRHVGGAHMHGGLKSVDTACPK